MKTVAIHPNILPIRTDIKHFNLSVIMQRFSDWVKTEIKQNQVICYLQETCLQYKNK